MLLINQLTCELWNNRKKIVIYAPQWKRCSTPTSGGCTPRATRAMARGSAQKIAEEAQKIAEEE